MNRVLLVFCFCWFFSCLLCWTGLDGMGEGAFLLGKWRLHGFLLFCSCLFAFALLCVVGVVAGRAAEENLWEEEVSGAAEKTPSRDGIHKACVCVRILRRLPG